MQRRVQEINGDRQDLQQSRVAGGHCIVTDVWPRNRERSERRCCTRAGMNSERRRRQIVTVNNELCYGEEATIGRP